MVPSLEQDAAVEIAGPDKDERVFFVARVAIALAMFTLPALAIADEPWSTSCAKTFDRARADLAARDPFFARGVVAQEQKAKGYTEQFLEVSFRLTVDKHLVLEATVSDYPMNLRGWSEASSRAQGSPMVEQKVANTDWMHDPDGARGRSKSQRRTFNEREGLLAADNVNKARMKRFFDRFRSAIDQCMALPYVSARK